MLAQLSADQAKPDSREEWCACLPCSRIQFVDHDVRVVLGSAVTRSCISSLFSLIFVGRSELRSQGQTFRSGDRRKSICPPYHNRYLTAAAKMADGAIADVEASSAHGTLADVCPCPSLLQYDHASQSRICAPGRNPRPFVRRMGCERLQLFFGAVVSPTESLNLTGRDDRARQNCAGIPGEQRSRESTGARRVQSRRARPCRFRGYIRGAVLELRVVVASLTLILS